VAAYREPLRVSDAAPDSLLEGNGFELSVPRCAGTGDSAAVVTPPDPGSEWRLLGPPLDNSVGVPKPATARMTGAPVDWPQLGRTHENRWLSKRGTERSNPFPSSGESGANPSLVGIRLPTSRSRGFPRVCAARLAARSAETRRVEQYRTKEHRALFQYRSAAGRFWGP